MLHRLSNNIGPSQKQAKHADRIYVCLKNIFNHFKY